MTITLDQFITINYKEISRLAKKYTDDWRNLITYYYLWLLEKPKKWELILEMNDNDRMAFTHKWFYNQTKWSNSDFSKEGKVNNMTEDQLSFIIPDITNEIEIRSEDVTDDIKDWLLDIDNEFGSSSDKLIKIRAIYLSTDYELTERVLYDMYFTNMMSERAIAFKLNIPHTSLHNMLVELKEKTKTLCGLTSSK